MLRLFAADDFTNYCFVEYFFSFFEHIVRYVSLLFLGQETKMETLHGAFDYVERKNNVTKRICSNGVNTMKTMNNNYIHTHNEILALYFYTVQNVCTVYIFRLKSIDKSIYRFGFGHVKEINSLS